MPRITSNILLPLIPPDGVPTNDTKIDQGSIETTSNPMNGQTAQPNHEIFHKQTSVANYNTWGPNPWKSTVPPEALTWPDYCSYTPKHIKNAQPMFTSANSPYALFTPLEYYLTKLGWRAASPIEGIRYVAPIKKIIRCHPSLIGPDRLLCAYRNSSLILQVLPRHWNSLVAIGFEFGKNIHCKEQKIDGLVDAVHNFANKVKFYQLIYEFYNKLVAKGKQHCFEEWNFVPETYNLKDPDQCRYFFDIVYPKAIDSVEERFFVKIAGIHAGEGVKVLTKDIKSIAWNKYNLGENCGAKGLPEIVAQKELRNLYLIEGRKSDIRTYSMVLSIKPLNMIMSPDFFFRRTLGKYDPTSTRPQDFLSQYVAHHSNTKVVDEAYVSDDEWVVYLTQQFGSPEEAQKKFVETASRMQIFTTKLMMIAYKALPKFPDAGDAFHLIGWDYMLDEDLNPWWIETNSSPQTNLGHFKSATKQPKYLASFVDRMHKGETPSELDLRVPDGKEFTRLIDFSKTEDVDKFFGTLPKECVSEFILS